MLDQWMTELLVLIHSVARFFDENHGPITAWATIALAVATIALARFTCTLWSTRRLVKASPQIERAYISGGGGRTFLPTEKDANRGVHLRSYRTVLISRQQLWEDARVRF
jgi:hypothetical protein